MEAANAMMVLLVMMEFAPNALKEPSSALSPTNASLSADKIQSMTTKLPNAFATLDTECIMDNVKSAPETISFLKDSASPAPSTQSSTLKPTDAIAKKDSTPIKLASALKNAELMKSMILPTKDANVFKDSLESAEHALSVLKVLPQLLMDQDAHLAHPMKILLMENVFANKDMPTMLVESALNAVIFLTVSSSMESALSALEVLSTMELVDADAQLVKFNKESAVFLNANLMRSPMPKETALLVEPIKSSPTENASVQLDTLPTDVEFALFLVEMVNSLSKEDAPSVPSTPSINLKSTDVDVPLATTRITSVPAAKLS